MIDREFYMLRVPDGTEVWMHGSMSRVPVTPKHHNEPGIYWRSNKSSHPAIFNKVQAAQTLQKTHAKGYELVKVRLVEVE